MPRILVADDDADARERIAAILQKEPVLTVVFAADGTEAMAEFDKAKPDLLLTDLRMPNMDGLDLVPRSP